MAKSESSKQATNNEVDLIDIFNRMGIAIKKGILAIGRGILIVLFFLLKNLVTLIISALIGVGITLVVKWITKPVYQSEIVFRSNTIPNSEMIDYMNRLNLAIKEKNYNELSKQLLITNDEAKGLKKLGAYWIIDKNVDTIPDYVDYRNKADVYDTLISRMNDRFQVRVRLTNPALLPSLKDGFIKYVDVNNVFQTANDLRLNSNEEIIKRLNYDIFLLDSLQRVKYFEETRRLVPDNGGQIVFLQEQKTQLVYEDIYLLYRRKHRLEEENKLYSGIITASTDFYMPVKRKNGLLFYGSFIIPIIFCAALLLLLYDANKKSLKDLLKKY